MAEHEKQGVPTHQPQEHQQNWREGRLGQQLVDLLEEAAEHRLKEE
ncbi:hypothetical protein [Ferrimonas gelatinilytica]|uniref:Uncharacterized protein n=1 Tax=Ferrimonas gelatinilytica TaxID=1255257 RepID=A0ABP9SC21_9GAMM